jgi:conjugative transposon TraK protein
MLIEDLSKKVRLAQLTVMLAIAGSVATCACCLFMCLNLVHEEHRQVYVLDGSIPFMAERNKNEMTFDIEAKAHIQLFHQYFFDLSPDDAYIKWTLGKAMYLCDESALKQKQAIEEKGFYSELMSASAVETIICDSILLDQRKMSFIYYGTQIIKRRTNSIRRSIVTAGNLINVPRTQNNPHGLMITNWRTLQNKDMEE